MTRRLVLVLGTALLLRAQPPASPAAAIVESAGEARLLPEGMQTEVALRDGDLLFSGDRISVDRGPVTLWHCPAAQSFRLEDGVSVRVEPRRIVAVAGRVGQAAAIPFCPLPAINRSDLARPTLYGQQLSRYRGIEEVRDERAALAPVVRAALENELRAIAAASTAPFLKDAATGAVLARYGLHGEAAQAYSRLSGEQNVVDWPRRLVHEERELFSRGPAAPAAIGGGKTYAILVGVSDYQRLPADQFLKYADRDAQSLYEFLRSPRGGAIPAENIRLLRNADATVAAIRTNIADFLRARATRNDTVILFLATHGVLQNDGAYVVGYDSDPDNLHDSAINMIEIQKLMESEFENVGRMLIFVDVCRAGLIGSIPNGDPSKVLPALLRLKAPETLGILASGPGESSLESPRFGGGHGAFSYFLLRALNGDGSDEDGDRRITADEVQEYVHSMVRRATDRRQNTRSTGDMPGQRVLIDDVTRQGIEIAGWQGPEVVAQGVAREMPSQSQGIPPFVLPATLMSAGVQAFEEALASGRLLSPDADNAAAILRRLSGGLSPIELLLLENQFRTALENRGHQVLLRYLRGEEVPQQREDFERGASWFEAALALDPDAQALESRAWFCRARAMLFDNRFDEARRLLERAARVEPSGPYLYNALGLLYLQQAAFSKAVAAFRDAIRMAPYWSYPRHNLALALTQTGEYNGAIAAYRDAQRITPQAWFIPYNLGLVEQRVGRWRESEAAFRDAATRAPGRPEPQTALGYLAAFRGRHGEAERLYRQALEKQPSFLPARHNLALLLSQVGRDAEAMTLWQAVLRDDPGFLASRLALAAALERTGRGEEAIAQYDEALRRDPELVAARLAAARLRLTLGRPAESERDMRALIAGQPGNPAAWETLADALAALGRNSEAIEAYAAAARVSTNERRRAVQHKATQLRRRRG